MEILDDVRGLAARYRGFVLDLWGVVHDGHAAYPGAAAALAALRDRGARVAFLSNAPRRAHVISAQLARFGVPRDLYVAAVTSGELGWITLRDRTPPFAGRRAYHLGIPGDLSVVEGLGVATDAAPGDADWVLNTGPDPARGNGAVEPYLPALAACLERGLPMLCLNPDRAVISGGRRVICAGALSEWYAARGGRTVELGKPDPAAYEPVLAALGLPASEVVAIGDSPHTDLAGAMAAGLDAVWALGGLAAEEGLDRASPEALAARAAAEGVRPLAALRGLRW